MFQKFFASLFTYAIALQLMVGAIPNTPVSWVAYGQSCAQGLQWSPQVNRCLSTEQAARVKEASAQCDKAGDDAAIKQCYKGVIEGKLSEAGKGEKGEIKGGAMSMLMPMASLVSAGLFLATGGPSGCPGASSAYLMVGSALAVIAGEIMSGKTYKKKVKAAQEKFEAHTKTANGTNSDGKQSDIANSTSSQAEAFQAMIEMEEAVIAAAKQKNQLYMVATAGYALAAVLSGIEAMKWTMASGTPAAAAVIPPLTCYPAVAQTDSIYDPSQNSFSQKPIELLYVDNYFQKKQRVDFKQYRNYSNLEKAESMLDFTFVNNEIMNLRNGANSSISYIEYEHSAKFARIINSFSNEELSFVKSSAILVGQFQVQEAHAFVESLSALASAAGAKVSAMAGAGLGLKKLYMTPFSRMVLAGIMTVNNMFMISKTNKEKEKAEDRKKFIESLKQQVSAAGAAFGCTSSDRTSNVSKPECYCYGENGQLNPSRSKSKTCEPYFGGKAQLASNKNNSIPESKTCMNNKGELDEGCGCRTSNSCSTIGTKISGNMPKGMDILGSLPATIDGLNNGTLSAQDINASEVGKIAARAKALNEKLLKDPKNKALALQAKKAEAEGQKIMRDLGGQLAAANPSLAASSDRSSSFMGSTNPDDALEKMKQDLKQDIRQIETAAVPVSGGSAAAKKDDFSLDSLNVGGITIAEEDLANQEKMEEIMAAQYEMGDSEINSDPGANIFQILTNRYQRSGMRRLFGAEKVVPADKPVEAPIAQ